MPALQALSHRDKNAATASQSAFVEVVIDAAARELSPRVRLQWTHESLRCQRPASQQSERVVLGEITCKQLVERPLPLTEHVRDEHARAGYTP